MRKSLKACIAGGQGAVKARHQIHLDAGMLFLERGHEPWGEIFRCRNHAQFQIADPAAGARIDLITEHSRPLIDGAQLPACEACGSQVSNAGWLKKLTGHVKKINFT